MVLRFVFASKRILAVSAMIPPLPWPSSPDLTQALPAISVGMIRGESEVESSSDLKWREEGLSTGKLGRPKEARAVERPNSKTAISCGERSRPTAEVWKGRETFEPKGKPEKALDYQSKAGDAE